MLPKQNRISKKEFFLLFKKGKRENSQNFQIIYFKNKNLKTSKFAFVVSSKISKKAVLRNKLKRRARHIVREKLKNFKTNCIAVIIFNKDAARADFLELKQEILNFLIKTDII